MTEKRKPPARRKKGAQGEPLWSGRFGKPPAPEAHALGRSIGFDARLAPQDIDASVAHVRALEDAGVLTADQAVELEKVLGELGVQIADGEFDFDPADEDIHSAVERGVIDRLGDLGARVHTGRSRNDLVATDVRLWLLGAGRRIDGLVVELIEALLARAREQAETVMPGTTHTRNAQPVTLGHHLLAFAWALLRDLERFDGWADRTSTSPLGAGALATSTLALDPDMTAARLGFRRAFWNSIDAISDRDFAQEFLAAAAILGTHLSRLAADLIRWTDETVGWAELDEAFATGSSMMPQKRNPDVTELTRAKAARLIGHFAALSSMLSGLPLGYHRDLQEDKEPVFDAADTLETTLAALTGCVATLRFHPGRMRGACSDDGLYATDLAEALVGLGVPFREAHRRTGELLKQAAAKGRSLRDLTAREWKSFGLPDGASHLDPDRSVRARAMPGGPSPDSVLRQADTIEGILEARH